MALNGTILEAHCYDAARNVHRSTIDLNDCLTNDFGSFRWMRYGNAFSSTEDIRLLDGHMLEAKLKNGHGGWHISRIDLDEMIENRNGCLTFDAGGDDIIFGTRSVFQTTGSAHDESSELSEPCWTPEEDESQPKIASSPAYASHVNDNVVEDKCPQPVHGTEPTKAAAEQSLEIDTTSKRSCTGYGGTRRR